MGMKGVSSEDSSFEVQRDEQLVHPTPLALFFCDDLLFKHDSRLGFVEVHRGRVQR